VSVQPSGTVTFVFTDVEGSMRIGVHTGGALVDSPNYVGADVHKAARIMSAAHGGQVVLSAATHELVVGEMLDLGRHRLKDFAEPVSLYQLGLERFPPLRTISNTNLPTALSSFVGREHELEEVIALVRDQSARLVTLAGPGGTGKTRLALEAARLERLTPGRPRAGLQGGSRRGSAPGDLAGHDRVGRSS
jgi:hypothetical protein